MLRVLEAIENAYFQPLWTNKDSDIGDLESIQRRRNMENSLKALSEEKNVKWRELEYNQIKQLVPTILPSQLRDWSLGPYALTLAKPYLEHSSNLRYFQHPQQKDVFKIKGLVSRFSKKMDPKKYQVFLKLNQNGNIEDILSYCTCKTGARTLGGCAHSTAILLTFCVTWAIISDNST